MNKTDNWRDNDPDKATAERWRKDYNNWKLGSLIYYNKEDKRLFVPKKLEWMGNTLNFANKNSVLVLVGFVLFLVVVFFLAQKKLSLFNS